MSFSTTRALGRNRVPDWLFTNPVVVFVESVVALALVWWAVAVIFDATDLISSPPLVGAELSALLQSGVWVPHVIDTTRRVLYGFALTIVVGTGIGVVMGWSNYWERALQDYIAVGLAIPSLFAAIFAAMWFGIGDVTPTVAATLIAFPFLTQNVYEGTKDIDSKLIEMSKSFSISRDRVVRRIVFQSILPEWFGGIRYAFAIAWKITALAELVAAESGVGFMIEKELQLLSLSGVLAWTLLFTALMMLIEYGVFQPIERRMFEWRENSTMAWV